VAQWLERRRKDLMIFASPVRIPLWDVGAGLSDETYKPMPRVAVGVGTQKNPLLLKAMSAKHRSKFAALSLVMVTAAG
jgi:hypothetical protein